MKELLFLALITKEFMDRTQELETLLTAEKSARDALTATNASLTAQVTDLQNQLAAAQGADTIGPDAVTAMQSEEAIVEPAPAPAPTTPASPSTSS